jgi:hypothetical protein
MAMAIAMAMTMAPQTRETWRMGRRRLNAIAAKNARNAQREACDVDELFHALAHNKAPVPERAEKRKPARSCDAQAG